MDVQEKLEELLKFHVGLKDYYELRKKKNEIKRHTQFIIAINQTRIELKLLRHETEELGKIIDDKEMTIKMMGDDASE